MLEIDRWPGGWLGMQIHGYTIPEEAISAGLAVMRGAFTSHQVAVAIRGYGLRPPPPPSWNGLSLSNEIANRLLQRERKAGRIVFDRDAQVWLEVDHGR